MDFRAKLKAIVEKYNDIEEKLSCHEIDGDLFAKLSKERKGIEDIAMSASRLFALQEEIIEIEKNIKEIVDNELLELLTEEKRDLKRQESALLEQIKLLLLPKDDDDNKNVIVEIRAGAGGDEAALFASVLFNMYKQYAELKGWNVEMLSASETNLDGYKEISFSISGKNVFSRLKYESGGHRVQRVPETETSGRVHTSAATVAVLPEPESIDVNIEQKDLRIDTYRASGAGGQHVNKTDSAIRITHIPTGIVVCQSEKSQHQNKARALKILSAKLYKEKRNIQDQERSKIRRSQIGSGDRSDKIRTYNYPQNRVTDHRIHYTSHALEKVISGINLDEFIDLLTTDEQSRLLAEQNRYEEN